MDEVWIEPTEEQKEEWRRDFEIMIQWANSLTKEQKAFLCDGGWYNNAIRGYLIAAARYADFTDEQIKELLGGLRWAFSEKNKADAEEISNDF